MTCEHCGHAVSSEHGNLDGVRDVTAGPSPGGESAVTVPGDAPLAAGAAAAALDEAGGCRPAG
jgi:hypothetical protein